MKPLDMSQRDAVINFQCLSPGLVRVVEMIEGKSIRRQEVLRHSEVVTELEERYIFFAKQADLARRNLRLGHSCAFHVYFREP